MLRRLVVLLALAGCSFAQFRSVCPAVLAYEDGGTEPDRWYARLTLTSDVAVSGVWLRIYLDRQAELLGNWFGDATSSDNKLYVIKKRDFLLPRNSPFTLRFFVKYDPSGPAPLVQRVQMNGRVICGFDDATTTAHLFLSHTSQAPSTERPASDEDFFQGDFSPNRNKFVTVVVSPDPGCGTVASFPKPLITHGEETVEGEWPWHAALYSSRGINLQYICGGSLISKRHVLTAAHCVTRPKTAQKVDADLFTVYLGKYNLHRLGPTVQDKTLRQITVHPEYNASYFHNDLAILHLQSPVRLTDNVRFVCLWEEDAGLNSVVNRTGTVVGWGFNENGNITENLMQAQMPIVSTETCIYSNRDFYSRFTSERTFCAGFRNGTSACSGDSGGGLVFPKSNQQNVWQLRGVVSLSALLQNETVPCDTSSYVVFTDAAKYLRWIRNTIAIN